MSRFPQKSQGLSDADLVCAAAGLATMARGAEAASIATVLEVDHPTLLGRVRVQLEREGACWEGWLPTVQNLPVRSGDRVLLLHPGNGREPIVVGVIDGFTRRPPPERKDVAPLALKRDQKLTIEGSRGTPLLAIYEDDTGAVVQLLQPNVRTVVDGDWEIDAERIHLNARRGAVRIEANDDVVVVGEVVRLN